MRILITGDTGFAGQHLTEHLSRQKNIRLFGLRRDLRGDVRDPDNLRKALRSTRPERIYHLAGQASVAESWKNPKETFDVNIGGTLNLLNAVHAECSKARVLIAGSAEEYGLSAQTVSRLKETTPLKPLNPYAVSKTAQSLLGAQFGISHGLYVVRTRAFNHFGPGQSETYVSANFAKQVARIEKSAQKPTIEVGDLTVIRDFTDVRDVVRAYQAALERGKSGEVYNVCSGIARNVGEILKFYLSQTLVTIAVQKKSHRLRRADLVRLVGDAGKLKARTGWKPEIPFERTLKDTLIYWRQKVGES